ncbi:unnamed protein product [Musa textilis]
MQENLLAETDVTSHSSSSEFEEVSVVKKRLLVSDALKKFYEQSLSHTAASKSLVNSLEEEINYISHHGNPLTGKNLDLILSHESICKASSCIAKYLIIFPCHF